MIQYKNPTVPHPLPQILLSSFSCPCAQLCVFDSRWQEAENTYLFIKFASALGLGRYRTFVACPALLEKCRYWFGALAACPAPAHPLIKEAAFGRLLKGGRAAFGFVVVGHAPLPIIINPPLDQAYKRLVAVALVLETQSVHGQNVCEFARFSTSHVVMTHKNICDCHIPFGPSC